ncbi:hypothetical protein [Flavobacterium sp.]|uniref:hypothetical protein n=1 Tax=Flavobacterium sp. TaxID=239 RepID=UPI0024892C71|nr:hypothetical protein [Flavobacterium sp.]MDI1316969.1 hypothetical protein [Flavobacterium sp.]
MKVSKFLHLMLFCCCLTNGYCQKQTVKKKESKVDFICYFSFGINYPFQLGKTVLAEAHSPNIGISAELGLVNFKKYNFGIGSDMNNYTVENIEIVGDYDTSKHNSYYVFLSFEQKVLNKLSLSPIIGFGSSELVIKKSGKRRGKQDGTEFRIGTAFNFNFSKNNAICLKVNYILNNYDVNTVESLQYFYGKSNQIQTAIVYKFK